MSESGGSEEAGGGSEMSDGIMEVLAPVIASLQHHVRATTDSQVLLASEMNALSEFLHSMGGDAPYDLEEYTRKIEASQRRMDNSATLLLRVHDRLAQLQKDLARFNYHQKQSIETQPPAPPTR